VQRPKSNIIAICTLPLAGHRPTARQIWTHVREAKVTNQASCLCWVLQPCSDLGLGAGQMSTLDHLVGGERCLAWLALGKFACGQRWLWARVSVWLCRSLSMARGRQSVRRTPEEWSREPAMTLQELVGAVALWFTDQVRG